MLRAENAHLRMSNERLLQQAKADQYFDDPFEPPPERSPHVEGAVWVPWSGSPAGSTAASSEGGFVSTEPGTPRSMTSYFFPSSSSGRGSLAPSEHAYEDSGSATPLASQHSWADPGVSPWDLRSHFFPSSSSGRGSHAPSEHACADSGRATPLTSQNSWGDTGMSTWDLRTHFFPSSSSGTGSHAPSEHACVDSGPATPLTGQHSWADGGMSMPMPAHLVGLNGFMPTGSSSAPAPCALMPVWFPGQALGLLLPSALLGDRGVIPNGIVQQARAMYEPAAPLPAQVPSLHSTWT